MTGYTDMRKSIDGLCAIVEDQLHMDPRRSALYLFCGKRCDRVKALLWENDGFVLLYKRMEVKGRFRWPRSSQEVRQLTWQQFDWLMSGLEIEQPKSFKTLPRPRHMRAKTPRAICVSRASGPRLWTGFGVMPN